MMISISKSIVASLEEPQHVVLYSTALVMSSDDAVQVSAASVMAGVISATQVWTNPAGMSVSLWQLQPSVILNQTQIAYLNPSGINSFFLTPDRVTVPLGARTLALPGSSQGPFISIERTLSFIRSSVRATLRQYIFAPNTSETWTKVLYSESALFAFIFKQGGLAS